MLRSEEMGTSVPTRTAKRFGVIPLSQKTWRFN